VSLLLLILTVIIVVGGAEEHFPYVSIRWLVVDNVTMRRFKSVWHGLESYTGQ
jgi:hypothetical protein